MAIPQRHAVIHTIIDVIGETYDETVSARAQMTKTLTKEAVNRVTEGIVKGDIAYGKDAKDEKAVRKYVSGVISNYLRKAKELAGK